MKSNTMSAFRAIVWKEVRENWYWAAAFSIILACVIAKNIAFELATLSISSPWNIWDSNWNIFSIAMPAFGLAIGLRQYLSEKQSDRWAFLLHRPVSRDVIFIGKAVTAVGLLAAAISVPLICAGIWLSTPGNFPAPWDWGLILPYRVLYVSAIGMYMSAITVGTRRARWYGSRGLPLVLAAAISTLISLVSRDTGVLPIAGAFVLISTFSARGSFLSDGKFSRAGRAGQTCQLITILASLLVISLMLGSCIPSLVPRDKHANAIVNTPDLEVADDGRVVIKQFLKQTTQSTAAVLSGGKVASGSAPVSGSYFTNLKGQRIEVKGLLTQNYSGFQGWSRSLGLESYRPANIVPIAETFNDSQIVPTADHLMVYYDIATNTLSEYSSRSHALVGSITQSGRTNLVQHLQPYPVQMFGGGDGSLYILTAHQLTSVNIRSGISTVVYIADEGETLRRASRFQSPDATAQWALVGSKGLVVKFPGQNPIHVNTYPSEKQFTRLVLYRTKTGKVVVNYLWSPDEPWSDVFETYSPAGMFVSRQTAPDLDNHLQPQHVDQTAQRITYSIAPLIISWLEEDSQLRDQRVHVETGQLSSFNTAMLEADIAALPVSALLSLVSVIAAWFYGRRAGLSKVATIGWAIAIVPLGWLGLLLLFSIVGVPVTETCSNCGRKRLVNQDQCQHCGASWLIPEPDGTEIFETAPIERPFTIDTV